MGISHRKGKTAMIVIGLTGGSGVGKGTVCRKFFEYGINSIDTDKTSREVCEKGKPCLSELVSTFGKEILNPDETLNRKALASIAFSDKTKHALLNKITHGHILNEARNWLDGQRNEKRIAAIVDAPLLFESGFHKECDVIIAVTAEKELQIQRILARDNITRDDALLRLSKQGDESFYTSRADYVIVNNGPESQLDRQVENIVKSIKESAKKDNV